LEADDSRDLSPLSASDALNEQNAEVLIESIGELTEEPLNRLLEELNG